MKFFSLLTLIGPDLTLTTVTETIDVRPDEQTGAVYARMRRSAEDRYGSRLAGHTVMAFSLTPAVLVPTEREI